eukprot:TRINITY_DN3735_c0_g1_i2.p3 TRINITY_DN3735_c0_g1~~TRINITY_DN3735_c0_g1_i2.p3  ORF type:complete len:177 (+),score=26.54 TRINITY_DN3735_c0_g1_i2:70-531(+)
MSLSNVNTCVNRTNLSLQSPLKLPITKLQTRRQLSVKRFAGEEQSQGSSTSKVEDANIVQAVEDEEDFEVEGYSLNQPSILEAEWFGLVWKIGFVSFSVGAVILLVYLATPVIDNTVSSFPTQIEKQSEVIDVEVEEEIEELPEASELVGSQK